MYEQENEVAKKIEKRQGCILWKIMNRKINMFKMTLLLHVLVIGPQGASVYTPGGAISPFVSSEQNLVIGRPKKPG